MSEQNPPVPTKTLPAFLWTLRSLPEFSSLTDAELKQRVRELHDRPAVRKTRILGLLACGLCAGMGSLLGDCLAPSGGRWGAAVGGGLGGLLFAQIQMRAVVREARDESGSKIV